MRKKPYNECPLCHAHLDPGEKCTCEEEAEKAQAEREQFIKRDAESGQLAFVFRREVV